MWNGIAFPFGRGANSFPRVSSDYDKVGESIHQILNTRRGERLMEPEFGSDLHTLVFESVGDEAIALGIYEIRRAIQAWEPRVRLGNIVGKIVGENQVDFEIEYSVQGLSTSQTETFYRGAQ